jgi:hypothetical protein
MSNELIDPSFEPVMEITIITVQAKSRGDEYRVVKTEPLIQKSAEYSAMN